MTGDGKASSSCIHKPLASLMSGQRIDKWLWFARVKKTRSQAARLVEEGCVRLNAVRIDRPAQMVRVGDVLTLSLDARIRLLRVSGFAERRGDAAQARTLFEDLNLDERQTN